MAELSTVARPYAEAVFQMCADPASSQRWSEVLAFLEVVTGDPAMKSVIGNPRIHRDVLLKLFSEVGGARLDAEARQLVAVLADNGRLSLLPAIRSPFEALRRDKEGVLDARIETAIALTDQQLATLVSDLTRRFKHAIRPAVVVDADLIGGVKVSVGDVVIDGSVRGRLDRMATALKS